MANDRILISGGLRATTPVPAPRAPSGLDLALLDRHNLADMPGGAETA